MTRALLVGVALLATAPLHAQRSRRSSGTHRGIPCGNSYISANKVCHVAATTTRDSSANGSRANGAFDSLPTAQLEARAGGRYQPPPWTAGIRARASSAADADAIRRERDSLRIVVATMKQMCTPKP